MRTVDPTPMLVEFTGGDDRPLRAVVSGEVDFASAPAMQARIIAACERHDARSLILDLAGVEFMDSSGLRVLLHLHRELDENAGSLVLLGPTEEVRNILGLTGLDQHLTVTASLQEAEQLIERGEQP